MPQGQTLPPMSRHQACLVGEDKIFIHTHRNQADILALDLASTPPTLRTLPVLPDERHGAPPALGLHSLTAVGQKLFLFGGAPQRGPMTDELWILDTAQQPLRWRRVAPAAGAAWPPPRCSHAAVAVGETLLVLGGSFYGSDGGLVPLGDAWALDTAAEEWKELEISGVRPAPRNAAAAAVLKSGEVLLQGGWEAFKHTYNDTFIMQLS